MKFTQRILAALICMMFVLCPFASAHSGRTDSSGGHRDNKNKSGLGYYHYHHGYGPHLHPNGVCPYATTSSGSSSSSSSSANADKKTITYPGISFTIDGEYFKPINESAKEIEAFVYAGTTYLPIRGIAYALGLNVSWDSKNNRIDLTSDGVVRYNSGKNTKSSRTETIIMPAVSRSVYLDGKKVDLKDGNGKSVNVFTLDGTTYVPVRAIANALGLDVDWDADTNTVHLMTNK